MRDFIVNNPVLVIVLSLVCAVVIWKLLSRHDEKTAEKQYEMVIEFIREFADITIDGKVIGAEFDEAVNLNRSLFGIAASYEADYENRRDEIMTKYVYCKKLGVPEYRLLRYRRELRRLERNYNTARGIKAYMGYEKDISWLRNAKAIMGNIVELCKDWRRTSFDPTGYCAMCKHGCGSCATCKTNSECSRYINDESCWEMIGSDEPEYEDFSL